MLVFFGRILGGIILCKGLSELIGEVFEEGTIRVFLLVGLYGEAGLLVILGGGVMDLLEDRQLANTGFELVHEGMLVNAVLIQALEAVQLHHIVMSEQLLEFFVLVTEHASATERTVFTIVEGPALGRFDMATFVIVVCRDLGLSSWMLIRTVLAESA